MEIYVVKPGDTIDSIAQKYGLSVVRLINENGLPNPNNLVQGQSLVITFPSQEHIVKEGETLSEIAKTYDVSVMQLLRNNSFLSSREYIYPGETLVIRYDTNGSIMTNGYAYDFINRDTLVETLPYLTYLSIFNYKLEKEGNIKKYGDDSMLIQTAKDYGVTPLLMISSLSPLGEPDPALVYEFLLNDNFQDTHNNKLINIITSSGYYGVNLLISELTTTSQPLYFNVWNKIANMLRSNGLLFFLTINPKIEDLNGNVSYEPIDYSMVGKLVDGIILLPYAWATSPGDPEPIISLSLLTKFINEAVSMIPAEKILLGIPLIGYDWVQPKSPTRSQAVSLTINSCIILASNTGSIIEFDDPSQMAFFSYQSVENSIQYHHIVWFPDVRSINTLNNIIRQYKLSGSGIWNLMIFYPPLWSSIIAQFDIVKLLPDNL